MTPIPPVGQHKSSSYVPIMGKSAPIRPGYTANIGLMIEHGVQCKEWCDRCKVRRMVDLVALAEKLGPEYDLWDRKTRCRMTPGCQGWNRFWHNWHGGFFTPMSGGQ